MSSNTENQIKVDSKPWLLFSSEIGHSIPKSLLQINRSVVIDGLKCSRFCVHFHLRIWRDKIQPPVLLLSPKKITVFIYGWENCVHFGELIRVSTVPKNNINPSFFYKCTPIRITKKKKNYWQYPMLASIWRHWLSHKLLMGMQNEAATPEVLQFLLKLNTT